MSLSTKVNNGLNILGTLFIKIPLAVFILGYVLAQIMSQIEFTSKNAEVASIIVLIIILLIFAISIFFTLHPRKKKEAINRLSKNERQAIRSIKLFNVENIDQAYEVVGMIESFDTNKTQAKEKLQLEALSIGANAVINVSTNIENKVTGSIGSVTTMPRMVSGNTSTVTTYHYEGTAIKLK